MTTESQHTPSPEVADDEIDLIQLAKTFWEGRKTIIKTVAIFAVLGLLVALFSAKQYTAATTMVPQGADGQSKLGSLSGLAAMASFNLNLGGASDITPAVYPQIISSVPFQLELMNTKLTFKGIGHPVSLFDYYTEYSKPTVFGYIKKFTIGLPGVILKAIRGKPEEGASTGYKGPIRLSEDQKEVQKKLADLVSIDYNDKDGYVTLTCNMPEALPAAQLAQHTQKMLQQYITDFKVKKAKASLEFVQQRYDETKKQFEKAQNGLARFRDRNKNVSTAMAQTELDRLSSNYNLIYGVYTELAKQLEQAKIQVKEDTPVFTIIEPVSVPLEKSKPKRAMILIIWIFLGGIIGTGMVFGREYLQQFRERWNAEEKVDGLSTES
ncbi:Wzz/FepE/Etk N-terminal domain-containing protein [Prolixibacter sp. SD074]|uniref:Wzz/FepE/Etk N-terminal domain-containing protein n=1 Tax=Prolixibacter sp. SD074 TaxID=2652391 RepID=UPI00127584D8|nr:Wzz/FepE/Etk N-terminal domain-containing protein [Prolixibacter sp. SD074]GET29316.1 chain-length determining protein [Prolixibacter sp. SD074]